MKKTFRKWVLFLLLLALLGCGGSKPSRYYLLNELKQIESTDLTTKQIKIGIGPIRFPEYLKRPQMGIFLTENQLSYAEYDRWAEPLDENFIRVLSQNLSEILQTDEVFTYPFIGNPQFEYQLVLDVSKFEMNNQDQVILSVQWQILQTEDQKSLSIKRKNYSQSVDPSSYASVAAGMSKTVESFSREIATVFREIEER